MAPRSYDDSEDPLMGRLVEITTDEGRWRPGVIAFCETTLAGFDLWLRDTTDARTLALAHAEISLLTSPGSHEESVDTSMSTSRRPYVGTAPSAVRAACSAFCSEASPEGGSGQSLAMWPV